MRYRMAIVVSVGALTLALGGCSRHGTVTARVPNSDTTTAPPPASAEHARTVLRISGENAEGAEVERLQKEDSAVAALIQRFNTNPNDLGATRELAAVYMNHNLYVSAFQLYQQLRLAKPSDAAAEIGLARIWYEWRDYDLALEHANRAVSPDPTSVEALETRGRIQLHRNEAGPALASFLAALERSPGNAPLLANAGYACILLRDWPQARLYLERAVEIDGTLAQAHNNLGIVLAHLGESKAALEQFMAADSPAAAHNNLGVACLAEGRWKEAQIEFQAALAIDPSYALAAQNLREVEQHLLPEMVDTAPSPAPVEREGISCAVQIFSTNDRELARVKIGQFVEKAGVQAVIEETDLGDKGTWFRGRINGFESFDSAMQMAKRLVAEGLIGEFWIVPADE